MESNFKIDDHLSYATEERLATTLKRLEFRAARWFVVRNREGRYTAIFPMGWNEHDGVELAVISEFGFLVIE